MLCVMWKKFLNIQPRIGRAPSSGFHNNFGWSYHVLAGILPQTEKRENLLDPLSAGELDLAAGFLLPPNDKKRACPYARFLRTLFAPPSNPWHCRTRSWRL